LTLNVLIASRSPTSLHTLAHVHYRSRDFTSSLDLDITLHN
jgi:hypothetical protein